MGEDAEIAAGAAEGAGGDTSLETAGFDLKGRKRTVLEQILKHDHGLFDEWFFDGRVGCGNEIETGGGDGETDGRGKGAQVGLDNLQALDLEASRVGGIESPDQACELDDGGGTAQTLSADTDVIIGRSALAEVVDEEDGFVQKAGKGDEHTDHGDSGGRGFGFGIGAAQAVDDDQAHLGEMSHDGKGADMSGPGEVQIFKRIGEGSDELVWGKVPSAGAGEVDGLGRFLLRTRGRRQVWQ